MGTKICRFSVIAPKLAVPQALSLEWLANRHEGRVAKLYRRYGVSPKKIAQRCFDIPDVDPLSPSKIYGDPPADMDQRMEYFRARANEVVTEFYRDAAVPPGHLIHVSCTGYAAPSAAQVLASAKKWNLPVTNAYHMGCYASLPAIRMADAFVGAKFTEDVDIVHTEMCSLHMNLTSQDPEQIVVQTLFADGYIKYSVVPDTASDKGLKLLAFKETIIPDTVDMMSWTPASWGMRMTLSRKVPSAISDHIRPFVIDLCETARVDLADTIKRGVFAIHPGGPAIIDYVQERLELSDAQVLASRMILSERGNMSSATLPHIWHRLLEQGIEPGTRVVSVAFGPGLTVFGAVFEVG